MSGDLVIGVDIGGTSTDVAALVDDEVIAVARSDTRPSSLVGDTIDTIGEVLDRVAEPTARLSAIGVGVPGQVDTEHGSVRFAVNLDIGAAPVELCAAIAGAFDVPVSIDNDVVAAALGSRRLLSRGEPVDDLAVVNVGTGVAVGLIIGGVPHRGVRGLAGEVGQALLMPDGTTTLEARVGGRSSAPRADRAAHLGWLAHWLALTYDVARVVFTGGAVAGEAALVDEIRASYAALLRRSPLGDAMLPADHLEVLGPETHVGPIGAAALASRPLVPLAPFHPEEGSP